MTESGIKSQVSSPGTWQEMKTKISKRPLFPTCQVVSKSYINNETGADALMNNRALGQSPEFTFLGLCPDMEVRVPVGAWLFNQTINNSHNNPRQYSGEDVEQELLHKATSFTEDCPANLIAHGFAQFNRAGRGLFVFYSKCRSVA